MAECYICHTSENVINHHEQWGDPLIEIPLCRHCHSLRHAFLTFYGINPKEQRPIRKHKALVIDIRTYRKLRSLKRSFEYKHNATKTMTHIIEDLLKLAEEKQK